MVNLGVPDWHVPTTGTPSPFLYPVHLAIAQKNGTQRVVAIDAYRSRVDADSATSCHRGPRVPRPRELIRRRPAQSHPSVTIERMVLPSNLSSSRSIHSASRVLASPVVRTLYVRNVPDEVGERLERLAAREGMSLSAFAARELAQVAQRADNPALLAGLPDLTINAGTVTADLDAGRAER